MKGRVWNGSDVILGVLLALFLFADSIVYSLYGPQFHPAARLVRMISLLIIPSMFSSALTWALLELWEFRRLRQAYLSSTLFLVLSSLVLSGYLGAAGGIASMYLYYPLLLFWLVYLARRAGLYVRIAVLKPLAASLLFLFLVYLFRSYMAASHIVTFTAIVVSLTGYVALIETFVGGMFKQLIGGLGSDPFS